MDQENKEILNEREIIKKNIKEIIKYFTEAREKKIKYKKNRNTALLKSVEERIIFKIDNPNYERKGPSNNSTH